MHFLIDFENVNNAGMRGTEHLLPEDHVIVFYSEAVNHMEMRYLRDIEASGCVFEICKLLKRDKNALDFYIATKTGEIFGAGLAAKLVIVSKDTGFKDVQEYWGTRARPQRRVLLSDSIERGLLESKSGERSAQVYEQLQSRNLGAFFLEYEKNRKMKSLLHQTFAGTEFSDRLDEIADILRSDKSAKLLYLDTLHRFGRRDGLILYQSLKKLAGF